MKASLLVVAAVALLVSAFMMFGVANASEWRSLSFMLLAISLISGSAYFIYPLLKTKATLRLVPNNKPLSLTGLDGSKVGVGVYELMVTGSWSGINIFKNIPGTPVQKCLTQDQADEFCRTSPGLLSEALTLFFCRSDESLPIGSVDETGNVPNVAVISTHVFHGLSSRSLSGLGDITFFLDGKPRVRVVLPQIA